LLGTESAPLSEGGRKEEGRKGGRKKANWGRKEAGKKCRAGERKRGHE